MLQKTCCQFKHKAFFWLLLIDRLNVRGMLRRWIMHLDDYSCALCSYQGDETIEHLFLTCLFVQACLNSIGLQANPDSAIFFMGILIIMSWTIWNSKNNLIFKNKSLSIQGAKSFFKKGFAMVIHREKPRYLLAIIHCWLDALL